MVVWMRLYIILCEEVRKDSISIFSNSKVIRVLAIDDPMPKETNAGACRIKVEAWPQEHAHKNMDPGITWHCLALCGLIWHENIFPGCSCDMWYTLQLSNDRLIN